MSDNVVSFNGVQSSSAKQAWLDQVAQAWDSFVAEHKSEPKAMFTVMLGTTYLGSEECMTYKSTWDIQKPWLGVPGCARGLLLLVSDMFRKEASD